jgi:hypothetical protein
MQAELEQPILPVLHRSEPQYYTDGYRWWLIPEGGLPLGPLPAGFTIPRHWIPFSMEEHRRYCREYGAPARVSGYRPTFQEWLQEQRDPKQVMLPAQWWEERA